MWCRSCTLRGCIRPRVQFAFRGQTDMGLWAKSLRIFNAFCDNAKQRIRQVAQPTGCSKSRVHRLTQAMQGREKHPESWWWETEAGRCWLIRLVVATLYPCGLTRGVGAETIRAFVGCRRLETQVGGAPSAWSGVRHAWEHEGVAAGEGRPLMG